MNPKSSDKLQGYQVNAPDWRTQLRVNNSRTRNVIIIFLLTYIAIGFLMDLYFYPSNPFQTTATVSMNQATNQAYPNVDNTDIKTEAMNLLSFNMLPIATFGMIMIAVFSLLITLSFHKKMVMLGTEYIEASPDSKDPDAKQLYNVVEELKIAAGLGFMPKVYIIEADYMNAFASGMSEKSALVAITRGLLEKLDRNELQAVMAHELSHIRHNDIRLTIMVALLSNLILIAIDILFRGVLYSRSREDGRLVIIIVAIRFLLPILTVLLMLYLSRTREYMADQGAVELMRDNEPLGRALLKIHNDHIKHLPSYKREYSSTAHEEVRNASYFYDPRYAGIKPLESLNSLFSTHPPLEARLEALGIIERPKSIS